MKWNLNYKEPARRWTDALPLGNGELGAMVFGKTECETIELNLDTLWSGDRQNKGLYTELPDWEHMRGLVTEGKHSEAEKYAREHILGDWTSAYLPAGTLKIQVHPGNQENPADYHRTLSLNDAVHSVEWKTGDCSFARECFVSMAENILAIKISVDSHSGMEAEISLDSQIQHHMAERAGASGIELWGSAPVYAAPNYYECKDPVRYQENEGTRFGLLADVQLSSGVLTREGHKLKVSTHEDFYVFLTGKTDFEGCTDISGQMYKDLEQAKKTGYQTLREEHLKEYQAYFDRMELELGEEPREDTDTLQRLKDFEKSGKDTNLYALLFHYARYLMICSSRPGTQAANLQGIWNSEMRPPWSSNYTVNINTEMNYWMAESCNLSECHMPLFDLIDRTVQNGRDTALKLYGLKGWVSHHNIDIWGHSDPVGKFGQDENPCQYSLWPMSSGWLCSHLWEHYCYTLDREFLEKRAYPVIREAVRFYLGYLTEYDGYLVTCPSTSPENTFFDKNGESHSVTIASAMDISILKELFGNYLKICEILGQEELKEQTEAALKKLPPFKIGSEGQLQEWYEDYRETDEHHRHVSHLYGLYPSDVIGEKDTELRKACVRSLERRGDEGTGWSMVWRAALWARLKNGDRALKLLKKQVSLTEQQEVALHGGGIYQNLFCAHPPFQIDGNFGFGAAVAEMLLQSQEQVIQLLPALPGEWENGQVRGLRARGGYTVDFKWKAGKVTEVKLTALKPGEVIIKYNQETHRVSFDKELELSL